MYKQLAQGIKRKILSLLYLLFFLMMTASVAETVYRTPDGTVGVYLLLGAFFCLCAYLLFVFTFKSYEYTLVGSDLIIRCFVFRKEKRTFTIHLSDEKVHFYRGSARLFQKPLFHRKICFLPFYGGLFKASAVCFPDRDGKPTKLIFKPNHQLTEALLSQEENIESMEPQQYPLSKGI